MNKAKRAEWLPFFILMLLIISLMLLWKGREITCPRLWIGAVLIFSYAFYLENINFWFVPKFGFYLGLFTAIVLLVIAYKWRLLSSGLIAAIMVLWPIGQYGRKISLFELGILLLATGFVSLLVGVDFNWKRSYSVQQE